MKHVLIFVLAVSCAALAQVPGDVMFAAPMQASTMSITAAGGPGVAVKGAPYTASITNESVQTLADGTRIVQSSGGSTARDSQGRTRQDVPLPAIGNLSADDGPHFVFVQDPVAGSAYTLNMTDKTAWKSLVPLPGGAPGMMVSTNTVMVRSGPGAPGGEPATASTMFIQKHVAEGEAGATASTDATLAGPHGSTGMFLHKRMAEAEGEGTTESLGSHGIEGGQATGVRTTQTIAAGKIGNDRPISIVTEVWTSPELKIVVLSKRNDPRTGEQTYKLTNIQRGEPDASLFTVPSDFKTVSNAGETILYKTKQ